MIDYRQFIDSFQKFRTEASDEVAANFPELYRTLKQDGSLIPCGTRINVNGKVFKAAVDLWDTAENDPVKAPTIWQELNFKQNYRIIPDVPTAFSASLAFNAGERGYFERDNSVYEAIVNGVVWSPMVAPNVWKLINTEADTK